MANKTKKKTTANQIQDIASNAGLLLMTAAATTLMMELPDHPNSKAVLAAQPVFAAPGQISEQEPTNNMRREREESGPHYISYSVAQRTPGRTGKY